MRDINITKRDINGNVTFGLTSDSISGMELLIQKVVIALLSDNAENLIQSITGGELSSVPKFTLNSNDLSDFKSSITSNIINIEKTIKNNDSKRIAPFTEKLDTLTVLDITVDKSTNTVILSLYIKNLAGDSTKLDLPVRV